MFEFHLNSAGRKIEMRNRRFLDALAKKVDEKVICSLKGEKRESMSFVSKSGESKKKRTVERSPPPCLRAELWPSVRFRTV
eukprot:16182738-Heterocapsa_arctica.AAC.1